VEVTIKELIDKIKEIYAVDHLPISDYKELMRIARTLQVQK
jgi:hypothetical protein